MNSPTPYAPLNLEKNDFTSSTATNGNKPTKFYQNNENFYTNQTEEKFDSKYNYDDKHFYSNVDNMSGQQQQQQQQVPDNRSGGAVKNAVYSNVESTMPISISHSSKKEKDLVYSNIKWNPKSENTYCNVPAGHNAGKFICLN